MGEKLGPTTAELSAAYLGAHNRALGDLIDVATLKTHDFTDRGRTLPKSLKHNGLLPTESRIIFPNELFDTIFATYDIESKAVSFDYVPQTTDPLSDAKRKREVKRLLTALTGDLTTILSGGGLLKRNISRTEIAKKILLEFIEKRDRLDLAGIKE